jgi:phage pi2 protein 07
MGFAWNLADTMIKASIQFSKTHKNHILQGDLNRILQIRNPQSYITPRKYGQQANCP